MFTLKQIMNGATIKKDKVCNYKKGYQVSVEDLMTIPAYKVRKKALLNIIASLKSNEYLGIWQDNKKVYIDKSIRKLNKADALKIAQAKNQLAIWDWGNKECISL